MSHKLDIPKTPVELAASADKLYRPALAGVTLASGSAYASDGHILVKMPAPTPSYADQENPVIVPTDALKAARKGGSKGGLSTYTIDREAGAVTVEARDGSSTTLPIIDGMPPDFERVLKDAPVEGEPGTLSVALDASLLLRLSDALNGKGAKAKNGVVLTVRTRKGGHLESIGVTGRDGDEARGIIMPMRLTAADK